MADVKTATDDEAQLRALIQEWAEAVRAKDVNAVMRHYAPDVVVFDVMPPLFVKGAESYRRNWQDWFDVLEGPADFQFVDLHLVVGAYLACCFSVNRLRARYRDGAKHDAQTRATVCWRKIDGRWLVVHEHASVPMPVPESIAT
ncbi:nuclear transport factor 2 family protein [Ralstonia solanacearum]|uniref:YybH family protein n=1 Tax=Ralstonia solanacearum TaxID=305 RepID=UPI0011421757|nr:nuclear transport factor 2 family protein [Ralstonia solanacearum]MBT1539567.1 nuclear transport factor 2 family protein [Ralstonia solanacearum]